MHLSDLWMHGYGWSVTIFKRKMEKSDLLKSKPIAGEEIKLWGK